MLHCVSLLLQVIKQAKVHLRSVHQLNTSDNMTKKLKLEHDLAITITCIIGMCLLRENIGDMMGAFCLSEVGSSQHLLIGICSSSAHYIAARSKMKDSLVRRWDNIF